MQILLKRVFIISSIWILFLFSAEAHENYPVWKVKLSYTLLAQGKKVYSQNPALAREYYFRALKIYPGNTEAKQLVENIKVKYRKPNVFSSKSEKINVPSPVKNSSVRILEKRRNNIITAQYKGIDKEDKYKAEERGPTVNTILDLYHPKHKGHTLPYYKDREGLKITPWLGIRGEYMYDEQPVGIESLMMEAQEYNQRNNEQIKNYISTNNKEYYREEVILHYKETWPTFTFIDHKEKCKREYDAKKLWSSNDTYYDDYDRRYYKIEYTIPRIKKIGFLKTTFRYGDHLGYRPNDPAAYIPFNSYLVELYTAPYSVFLNGTFGVKLTSLYGEGKYRRAEEQGWGERKYKEHHYWLELDFYNQRKYLRIKPHFEYEKERHYPSYNTWWTRKTGVKIEKELNGNLKYTTDWTYIKYTRDKDPFNAVSSSYPPNHIASSAWTWENEIEYEIVRDLKLKFGLDYSNGLGFSGFDSYTIRTELQLRKPGLIDFRIGYRYIDYFNINDGVDTVFFKLGWFI